MLLSSSLDLLLVSALLCCAFWLRSEARQSRVLTIATRIQDWSLVDCSKMTTITKHFV
jgi:hypothetical protein